MSQPEAATFDSDVELIRDYLVNRPCGRGLVRHEAATAFVRVIEKIEHLSRLIPREEIALRLAATFIRLSREPLHAHFGGTAMSKDDISRTLDALAQKTRKVGNDRT
jgi:hypothetical protein